MSTTAVKERPILFSAEMVRTILAGEKTQTRRIITLTDKTILSPGMRKIGHTYSIDHARVGDVGRMLARIGGASSPPPIEQQISIPIRHPEDPPEWTWEDCAHERIWCPYGSPGDRLWVRETWAMRNDTEPSSEHAKHYLRFAADGNGFDPRDEMNYHDWERWRPSIHMPRWASRITLEITEVRVQRLQEISEEDAIAEGCTPNPAKPEIWWQGYHKTHRDRFGNLLHHQSPSGSATPPNDMLDPKRIDLPAGWLTTAAQRFRELWNKINGKGSWEANPFVWAITFKRIK